MKIFELKKPLKEAVDPQVLAKVKAALAVYKQTKAGGSQQGTTDTQGGDTAAAQDQGGSTRDQIEAARKGNANINKLVDQQIATGNDAQRVHIAIVSAIQEAARTLAQAEIKAGGNRSEYRMINRTIDIQLMSAVFGYINKKYLGGSDTQLNGNTMDIVKQAIAKRSAPQGGQRQGGQMPVGQVSSSRPAGQQGTVQAGDETNALDAMAADRNRDF